MDGLLKTKFGRELKDYVAITFGLVCYAFGWVAFMLPYQISTGGLTGISALIYYVTGIEIQVSYHPYTMVLFLFLSDFYSGITLFDYYVRRRKADRTSARTPIPLSYHILI